MPLVEMPLVVRTFTRFDRQELARSVSHHYDLVEAIDGRNADWAESAVRAAASLSASAALEQNVIVVIAGDVTGRNGGFLGGGLVGYGGAFATAGASIAAPVPEPKTYALLVLGLIAVGSVVRRRNQA